MAGLSDLIKELGDENTEFQLLNHSLLSKVEKKSTKDCEITFCASPDKMNINSQAIIIWTSVDDLDRALKSVSKK